MVITQDNQDLSELEAIMLDEKIEIQPKN